MPLLNRIFSTPKPLVGMIHLGALPGTPASRRGVREIAARAGAEARLLASAGFDGLMIENMHDTPYVHGTQGPHIASAMTRAALAVRDAAQELPLGVQVLSGGQREALAVALAVSSGPQDRLFVRVENFVYAHVADEGLLDMAVAGPLLRYRREIGAEHVALFCDINKKHASHALTADLSLTDLAHAAEFFRADALVVTGRFTGDPADADDLAEVRGATRLPVVVGSGVTPANIESMFAHADAVIAGSWYKRAGLWSADPDPKRAARLVAAAHVARAAHRAAKPRPRR